MLSHWDGGEGGGHVHAGGGGSVEGVPQHTSTWPPYPSPLPHPLARWAPTPCAPTLIITITPLRTHPHHPLAYRPSIPLLPPPPPDPPPFAPPPTLPASASAPPAALAAAWPSCSHGVPWQRTGLRPGGWRGGFRAGYMGGQGLGPVTWVPSHSATIRWRLPLLH